MKKENNEKIDSQAIEKLEEKIKNRERKKRKRMDISGKDVFKIQELKDKKEENFYILMLDTKNNLIGEPVLITKGILDASIIHPREVFKPAIKNSTSKIILVHNHPSGDPKPSNEDIEITEKLMRTGEELSIKVLDHVILGGEEFWGWKEKS